MPPKISHGEIFPDFLHLLPPRLKKDFLFLKELFFENGLRAYLVGGAVRDMVRVLFLNERVDIVDLDIEVYDISEDRFAKLMESIGAKGVGRSFFVYKYKEHIDISLPRRESKIAPGHRGFRVEYVKSEKEASRRRDFKMNALMIEVFTRRFLDFWGGVEDIFSKRISVVDPKSFVEDSLRVLRGMQFAARLGYKIDKASCEIMKSMELEDLSSERVFWEFEKMFKGSYPHYGLYYLLSLKISKKIFDLDPGGAFFYECAREMAKCRKNFEPHLYKFYFIYIFAKALHIGYGRLLTPLEAPNEYKRVFKKQKYVPKNITDRFLAALAMLYPLKEWLGNYREDVKIRSKELGIWDKKFDCEIKPSDLMREGFYGKELGIELKKRVLRCVKSRFKGAK